MVIGVTLKKKAENRRGKEGKTEGRAGGKEGRRKEEGRQK